MSRLRGPLLSLDASGRLTRALTLARRLTGPAWLLRGRPDNPRTDAQVAWRTMWQLAASLWHQLSAAEQAVWETQGTARGMTGFAWYMSQALRPNPGIYLPLAGGTMSGNIAMDGHQVTAMLDPTADQDAATKKYHDDNLPVGGYTQGASVYKTTFQSIPDTAWTTLTFNAEHYDTDNIHDNVTNPTRLTCKTPGIYLIVGHFEMQPNATGDRSAYVRLNGSIILVRQATTPVASANTSFNLTTIAQLALNNYVELRTIQTSGGALIVYATPQLSPAFMMQRIG